MTNVTAARVDRHVGARPTHHLVTMLVENKAGVLVRIAGLFARRGYNIFSLAVAPTDDPLFSRISVVVDVESAPLEQILSQLNKLVNVVEITELHPDDANEAELLLATVRKEGKSGLKGLCKQHGATVIDDDGAEATVMLAGNPEALDGFESELSALGIVGLQRTGRIALPKLKAADAPAGRKMSALKPR